MKTIREKYLKIISPLLCFIIIFISSITYIPYFHNLEADLNIWNVDSLIILEGKHNHEDNPNSACFDFHQIRLVEVGDCPVCQFGNNSRYLFFSFINNFFYDAFVQKNSFSDSYHFSTYKYNIPHLRAPPVS